MRKIVALIPLLLLLACFLIGVSGLLVGVLQRGASVFAWMAIVPVLIVSSGATLGCLILAVNYALPDFTLPENPHTKLES